MITTHYITESQWWRDALAGLRPAIHEGNPHAGYYERRLIKGGPWVAVSIFLVEQRFADTGELAADVEYKALVNGTPANPFDIWTWVCARPISKSKYDSMTGFSDPTAPVDYTTAPTIW